MNILDGLSNILRSDDGEKYYKPVAMALKFLKCIDTEEAQFVCVTDFSSIWIEWDGIAVTFAKGSEVINNVWCIECFSDHIEVSSENDEDECFSFV